MKETKKTNHKEPVRPIYLKAYSSLKNDSLLYKECGSNVEQLLSGIPKIIIVVYFIIYIELKL